MHARARLPHHAVIKGWTSQYHFTNMVGNRSAHPFKGPSRLMGPRNGQQYLLHAPATSAYFSLAGVFSTLTGAYSFQFRAGTPDNYLAVVSIRHPNISTSPVAAFCHIAAVVNVATAAPATPAFNATASTATVTAASLAIFNPLANPSISCGVSLPRLSASTYAGGSSKLLADFGAVVAANAVLDGPNWVQASVVNATPAVLNATVRGERQLLGAGHVTLPGYQGL